MRGRLNTLLEQETWFYVFYLIVTLLSFNSLCIRTRGLLFAAYAAAACGGVILLYRICHIRRYRNTRALPWLILLWISYGISSLRMWRYGMLENIQAMVWMAIQYFILYAYESDSPISRDKRNIRVVGWVFLGYTFAAAGIAMVMLVLDYGKIVVLEDTLAITGLVWNRLWGIYSDVNFGAVCSLVSMVFSAFFFRRCRMGLRIFLGMNLVLQACYVAFSDSRTAQVGAAVTVFVVALLLLRAKAVQNKQVVRVLAGIALSAVFAAGTVLGIQGIQKAGNALKSIQVQAEESPSAPETAEPEPSQETQQIASPSAAMAQSSEPEASAAEPSQETQQIASPSAAMAQSPEPEEHAVIGRDMDDINGDISNRRFQIWKSGIEIVKTSPVFGVSFRHYVRYAQEHLPDTYIVNNDQTQFGSMHNALIDVLVSQGVLGAGLLICLIVSVAAAVIPYLLRATSRNDYYCVFLLAVLLPILCTAMFYSEIFYINSPGSFLFWMFLGRLMHCVTQQDPEQNQETPLDVQRPHDAGGQAFAGVREISNDGKGAVVCKRF